MLVFTFLNFGGAGPPRGWYRYNFKNFGQISSNRVSLDLSRQDTQVMGGILSIFASGGSGPPPKGDIDITSTI